MAARQRTRRSTSRTSPTPPVMATTRNEVPVVQDIVVQDDLQLEAKAAVEEEPFPPTIGDLDCITDDSEFGKIYDALDQEDGNGGDSDEEGEEYEIHDEAITKTLLNRHCQEDDFLACENISARDIAFVVGKKEVMDVIPEAILSTVSKIPSDWVPPPKKDPLEPDFKDVDNPGGWNSFIFRPIYEKTG